MKTSYDGVDFIHSIVRLQIRLLGDGKEADRVLLASDMLSSEEPSVYGPGAWSNHRQRAAEDRQHDRHPNITPSCENDP